MDISNIPHISVIIPCGGERDPQLRSLISSVIAQTSPGSEIIIIDSSSKGYRLPEEPWSDRCQLHRIRPEDFGHGKTRTLGACLARHDILVYLTDDVELCEDAIPRLVAAFNSPDVGLAFGRQLPRKGAGLFETFARLFNYPETSYRRQFEDRHRYGIKTAFFSDSFSAYRRKTLEDCGFFPEDALMGEDTLVAAKALELGWTLVYEASACVRHSHPYSPLQEMRRYFDIGVFHTENKHFLFLFGKVQQEGWRYLKEEFRFLLMRKAFALIPLWLLRTFLKYLGYSLGRIHHLIPQSFKKSLSMYGKKL